MNKENTEPQTSDAPATNTLVVEPNLTHKEYTLVIWSHLLGLFTLGIFPLKVYLQHRKSKPFVAFHALQSLLMSIPILGSLAISTRFVAPLNIIYIYACTTFWGVLALVAAAKANQGYWFELPLFGRVAKKMMEGK